MGREILGKAEVATDFCFSFNGFMFCDGLIQYALCTVFQDTFAGLTGRPISLPVGLCSVTEGLLSGQQIGFLKVGATSN